MKLLPIIALLGLALTIIPPVLHLLADLSQKTTFTLMAVGMVVWYLAATPWLALGKTKSETSNNSQL